MGMGTHHKSYLDSCMCHDRCALIRLSRLPFRLPGLDWRAKALYTQQIVNAIANANGPGSQVNGPGSQANGPRSQALSEMSFFIRLFT